MTSQSSSARVSAGSTSGLQGRVSTLTASYSTPDLCFSPSGTTLAQSISVPSLSSASDLSSSSYSSIPFSSSNCTINSINSTRSSGRPFYGHRRFDGDGVLDYAWLSRQSPTLPLHMPARYPSSRRASRPLASLGRLMRDYTGVLFAYLPHSLWDRAVFLVFCIYVVILSKALLGIDVGPATAICSPAAQPSAFNSTAFSDSLLHNLDSRPQVDLKVVAPAAAFMPSKQDARLDRQNSIPAEAFPRVERAVEGTARQSSPDRVVSSGSGNERRQDATTGPDSSSEDLSRRQETDTSLYDCD